MSPGDDGAGMLRLLGILPPATREEMVRMYRAMLTAQLDELDLALEQARMAEATGLAHKIAGSAAMMQDRALSDAARSMEAALRDGRHGDALAARPAVREQAAATLAALHGAFPGPR